MHRSNWDITREFILQLPQARQRSQNAQIVPHVCIWFQEVGSQPKAIWEMMMSSRGRKGQRITEDKFQEEISQGNCKKPSTCEQTGQDKHGIQKNCMRSYLEGSKSSAMATISIGSTLSISCDFNISSPIGDGTEEDAASCNCGFLLLYRHCISLG